MCSHLNSGLNVAMSVFLVQVTVTPGPSSDYTLTPLSGDLYTSCLCANERKTLRWTMIPTALGENQALVLHTARKPLCGRLSTTQVQDPEAGSELSGSDLKRIHIRWLNRINESKTIKSNYKNTM